MDNREYNFDQYANVKKNKYEIEDLYNPSSSHKMGQTSYKYYSDSLSMI